MMCIKDEETQERLYSKIYARGQRYVATYVCIYFATIITPHVSGKPTFMYVLTDVPKLDPNT